jgi:ribonuclease I
MQQSVNRRKRLTLHGLPPGPERNKLALEIQKQRANEENTAWQAYKAWITH